MVRDVLDHLGANDGVKALGGKGQSEHGALDEMPMSAPKEPQLRQEDVQADGVGGPE